VIVKFGESFNPRRDQVFKPLNIDFVCKIKINKSIFDFSRAFTDPQILEAFHSQLNGEF
jgi:hypothetical protein